MKLVKLLAGEVFSILLFMAAVTLCVWGIAQGLERQFRPSVDAVERVEWVTKELKALGR